MLGHWSFRLGAAGIAAVAAACAGRSAAVRVEPVPAGMLDEVKLAALPYIFGDLRGANFRLQLLLDSMVGPTPEGLGAPRAHSRTFLDSASRALHADSVTGLARRSLDAPPGFYVLIGQPYLIGPGEVAVQYSTRPATVYTNPATECGATWEIRLRHTATGFAGAGRRRVFQGC